jgi:hypothetical protein
MLKQLNILQDIEYNNLTYNNLVKIRQTISNIKRLSDEYYSHFYMHERYSFKRSFEQFIELTNISYGYIENPFNQQKSIVNKFLHYLSVIDETLSHYWLLEYNEYQVGKKAKQTFNTSVFLDHEVLHDFLVSLNNFTGVFEEYEKIKYETSGEFFDIRMTIYKQALRTTPRFNQTWLTSHSWAKRASDYTDEYFVFVDVREEITHITKYTFYEWQISKNKTTESTKNIKEGEYEKAVKKVFPEWYL